VKQDKFHIDILTAHFVQRPDFFDVVVASNLFGDILSDLGPACTGTIGIAPSANLNPDRKFPSLFEPVHGSAPDIYGKNIANPIGQIWCGAMMLEFLGHKDAHDAILKAIEKVLDPKSVHRARRHRRQGQHHRRRQGDRRGAVTICARSRGSAAPCAVPHEIARSRSRAPLECASACCIAAGRIDTVCGGGFNRRQWPQAADTSPLPRHSPQRGRAGTGDKFLKRRTVQNHFLTRGPCEQDRTDRAHRQSTPTSPRPPPRARWSR
jgi:hypothetical protein